MFKNFIQEIQINTKLHIIPLKVLYIPGMWFFFPVKTFQVEYFRSYNLYNLKRSFPSRWELPLAFPFVGSVLLI